MLDNTKFIAGELSLKVSQSQFLWFYYIMRSAAQQGNKSNLQLGNYKTSARLLIRNPCVLFDNNQT